MNKLFYGDNLDIMQQMHKDCVDLIYLDPPFKSNKDYNLLYKTMTGKPVPEQVEAFCDTWEMDADKERLARTMPTLMKEHGIDDYYVKFWQLWMNALRNTQPHLLAYLIYMVQRLLYMKVLLRPTGSIYLHCDPTVSHYIKIMMDGIFGHNNFRNEIIWRRTGAHGHARRWGPIHDTLLFYTKTENYTWNRVFEQYDESYLNNFYRFHDAHGRYRLVTLDGPGSRYGDSGKPWRDIDPTTKKRHWVLPPYRALPQEFEVPSEYSKMSTQERLDMIDAAGLIYWPPKGSVPQYKRYLEVSEGNPVQDIISDIRPVGSQAKERLGYPTQKPIALLERIIRASSNEGDVVFDPFCGCGTTIYAAIKNSRKWIGCDIAILSIWIIKSILSGNDYRLVEGTHYDIDGIPVSIEQAETLFKKNPFQFQHWAIERVRGFPMQKKVADKGIDGRIYFETRDGLKDMILSVKGGNIKPTDIRELRGVLEREPNAMLAGFISLREPTKAMKEEAARANSFDYNGVPYERIQLLTIREILEEKKEFYTPSKLGIRGSTGQQNLPLLPTN